MKIPMRLILLAGGTFAAIGLAVFWMGLINVGASTGHWAITDWVLHTAMRRSVAFRADQPVPPDYPAPAMVRRGAAHFEAGCAYCHGSPMMERSPVVLAMTPAPPDLSPRIAEWNAEELFWIVKNGVKFTGMPAWPAENRDDEVWSVVAFLEQLPKLTATEYRNLAYGSSDEAIEKETSLTQHGTVPSAILEDCVRCHKANGRGDPNGAFPRLDIQQEPYLLAALEAYAEGRRSSGIMQLAVSGLTRRDLELLAKHFATFDRNVVGLEDDTGTEPQSERGRQIALHGIPAENIAACTGCHGQANPAFPRLNGQYRQYLESQLQLFSEGTGRGGGRFIELMTTSAHRLRHSDIDAVALWYSSRPVD
jgi:cytochrome c553